MRPATTLRSTALMGILLLGTTSCADPEDGADGEIDATAESEAVESPTGTSRASTQEGGQGSSAYIARDATWEGVHEGVRLVLRFDEESGMFTGTLLNSTDSRICAAQAEVHLGDGTELGPTDPVDLAPGESMPAALEAEGEGFTTWTAHPHHSSCGA